MYKYWVMEMMQAHHQQSLTTQMKQRRFGNGHISSSAEPNGNARPAETIPNGKANGLHVKNGKRKIKTAPRPTKNQEKEEGFSYETTPLVWAVITFWCYLILTIVGWFRDQLRRLGMENTRGGKESKHMLAFPPLYQDFDNFYIRHMFVKLRDNMFQPLSSTPGAEFDILERHSEDFNWTYKLTGRKLRCLNLGSYNYLGFAENSGPRNEVVQESIRKYGAGTGSARAELGTLDLHLELERLVADFTGQEDAITFGMGFATNALNIPALVGKGSLVISDKLNHASLVLGIRLSGAVVRVFKHNDMEDLEKVLRRAVVEGQPRTHRPWKKILIVAEGVYSMEGSIVKLPELIALKKKYKAYVYLDEAHSIGAMGPTGKGVVEYWGVDPKDVDIMMGTFTKSFGSSGGYIAASKKIVNYLRLHSHSATYSTAMPAPVAQQIVGCFKALATKEGQHRAKVLAWNTRYFRNKIKQLGFIVYGHEDSPVVPIMYYLPSKLGAMARMCRQKGIAVVIVGFPATPITEARVRVCLSASHTVEMLDKAIDVFDELGDLLWAKYSCEKPEMCPVPPYPTLEEATE